MSMIAGMIEKFGKSLTIQRESRTQGGYTGDTVTWSTLATVICVFRPISGNDAVTLSKIGLQADYTVYVDYQDILEKDRIVCDGRYYIVQYIKNPMSANDFLQVYIKGSDNIDSNVQ